MPNFFQRIVNAALGTSFGEKPAPPAQPPAVPPTPTPPRRVEFPIGPAQGPRRLAVPAFTPQPVTRTLVLSGSTANDGYGKGTGKAHREARIGFSESQWKRYLYYQSIGKTETARVYALAEVYGVPQLAGASWDAEFDYDEFPEYEWPDYDEYNYYALE